MQEIEMRNLGCEVCRGFEESVYRGICLTRRRWWCQSKNEFLHCMGPWAQSLTSERKRKVRNKKELDFRTTSFLDSSIILLLLSVLLSLYKNLIIKDYRDSSTLKSTYCPCRDPSSVPSIHKGPLTTFCNSRRMDPPQVCIRMLVHTYTYTHNQKILKKAILKLCFNLSSHQGMLTEVSRPLYLVVNLPSISAAKRIWHIVNYHSNEVECKKKKKSKVF